MKKRNKIAIKSNGEFSMKHLNKNERESLNSERENLRSIIGGGFVDNYIIAMYDESTNQIYFVNENAYTGTRAIIL